MARQLACWTIETLHRSTCYIWVKHSLCIRNISPKFRHNLPSTHFFCCKKWSFKSVHIMFVNAMAILVKDTTAQICHRQVAMCHTTNFFSHNKRLQIYSLFWKYTLPYPPNMGTRQWRWIHPCSGFWKYMFPRTALLWHDFKKGCGVVVLGTLFQLTQLREHIFSGHGCFTATPNQSLWRQSLVMF